MGYSYQEVSQQIVEPPVATVLIVFSAHGAPIHCIADLLRAGGVDEWSEVAARRWLQAGSSKVRLSEEGTLAMVPISSPEVPERMEEWLDTTEESHLLVVYEGPDQVVSSALQDGENPKSALEDWACRLQEILVLCERHRRRITLVESEKAHASPPTFVRQLSGRLGRELMAPPIYLEFDATRKDTVATLVSTLFVKATTELAGMLRNLEACSLPVCDPSSQARVIDDPVEYLIRGVGGTLQTYERLREENELLLIQLDALQKEISRQSKALKEADRKRQRINSEQAVLKQRIESLETSNGSLKSRLERVERNLAAIKSSLSWKVTVPLRQIRGGLKALKG